MKLSDLVTLINKYDRLKRDLQLRKDDLNRAFSSENKHLQLHAGRERIIIDSPELVAQAETYCMSKLREDEEELARREAQLIAIAEGYKE